MPHGGEPISRLLNCDRHVTQTLAENSRVFSICEKDSGGGGLENRRQSYERWYSQNKRLQRVSKNTQGYALICYAAFVLGRIVNENEFTGVHFPEFNAEQEKAKRSARRPT